MSRDTGAPGVTGCPLKEEEQGMLEEFPCTAPDQQCHQPDRMGAMGGPAGISPLPLREGTDMPEDRKHHNRRGRIRLVKGAS